MKKQKAVETPGSRVRRLRKAADMTQETLAKEAGINPSELSLLESGKRPISLKRLEALAAALGVSPAVLGGWPT